MKHLSTIFCVFLYIVTMGIVVNSVLTYYGLEKNEFNILISMFLYLVVTSCLVMISKMIFKLIKLS